MSTESDSIFVRNFSIILLGLAGVGVIAFILASLISGQAKESQYAVADVAERVSPAGQVNTSGEPVKIGASGATEAAQSAAGAGEGMADAGASEPEPSMTAGEPMAAVADSGGAEPAAAGGDGKRVYDSLCASCHAQGIAGAPKFGDQGAWAARLDKGLDMLVSNAINGYVGENGVMPAKGGNPALSDAEVRAAVEYMVDAVDSGAAGDAQAAAGPESASADEEAQAAAGPESASADEEAMAASEETTADGDMASEGSDDGAGHAMSGSMDEAMAGKQATAAGETAAAVADAGLDLTRGKEVYDSACWLCHTPGAAGAPKFGDAGAWGPRIDKGMATLYEHAINGFMGSAGLMPPKGGRTDLSDDDVKAAVAYMVEGSR